MVKLRAPDNISSIVHDGVEVPIGDDRSVDADENTAEVFKVHGFRPWDRGENAVPIDAVPHFSHMVLDLLKRPRRPLDVRPAGILQASLPIPAQGAVIPPTETCGEHEQDISSSTGGRFLLSSERRESQWPCLLPMKNYAPRHAAHAKAERFQYSSSATRAVLTLMETMAGFPKVRPPHDVKCLTTGP